MGKVGLNVPLQFLHPLSHGSSLLVGKSKRRLAYPLFLGSGFGITLSPIVSNRRLNQGNGFVLVGCQFGFSIFINDVLPPKLAAAFLFLFRQLLGGHGRLPFRRGFGFLAVFCSS